MKHKSPLVSVIIPSYNHADLLPRAVHSACAQTYKHIEILIVDDASTDNTPAVGAMLEKEDSRIRYIRKEENGGVNAARNTGIRASIGEYIALLDSDDEWLPTKLQEQMNVFFKSATPQLGLVYCKYENICVSNEKTYSEKLPVPKGDMIQNLLVYNIVLGGGSGAVIKKECLDVVGFFDENRTLKIGEDHEMWLRIATHYEFDYIKNTGFKYYIHENSATRKTAQNVFIASQDYIFQKHRTLYETYPSAYTKALVRYALRLVLYKQPRRAMHTMVQAFKMRPCVAFFAVPTHTFSFASKIIRKKIHGC